MNIVKLQNDLKDLSDSQLLQTMQAGSSPQYLVLAEMQRRKKMREESASPNEPQSQGTVADEIMGGIAAIPAPNMAPQQGMYSGGLVSFAKGGMTAYQKGEAEACWKNPETGETECPSGRPDLRYPTKGKKYQMGGTVGADEARSLLAQFGYVGAGQLSDAEAISLAEKMAGSTVMVPDVSTEADTSDDRMYLRTMGAEGVDQLSDSQAGDYASRVRALGENEVRGEGAMMPGEQAPLSMPSAGRAQDAGITSLPQVTRPMQGGEYAPGFSPVAPVQRGEEMAPMAPEGPGAEEAVPFLGQAAEGLMGLLPAAQAAEDMPPVEAGLSADEARQIMKENAPSWYDVSGRSDVQVIGDAMKLLSGNTGTRWEEEAEKKSGWSRNPFTSVKESLGNMFGQYTQPNPFLEASGVAPVIAGQTVINAASSEPTPPETTPPETTPPPAVTPATPPAGQAPAEPPKAPSEPPELPEKELTGREAYFDYLLKRRKGLEGKEKDAVNQALLAAGLSMMSSKDPSFLGAIGEGGLKGLEQYTKARKEREDQILALLKEEGDIYAAESMYGTRQGQLGVSAFDKAAKILEGKYSGLGRAQTRAALKSKYPNAKPEQLEKAIDQQYMREVEALAARMQGTSVGAMSAPALEGAKFLGFE